MDRKEPSLFNQDNDYKWTSKDNTNLNEPKFEIDSTKENILDTPPEVEKIQTSKTYSTFTTGDEKAGNEQNKDEKIEDIKSSSKNDSATTNFNSSPTVLSITAQPQPEQEAPANKQTDFDFENQEKKSSYADSPFARIANTGKNSIFLIFGVLLGIAFIGLISLAFWQWENIQKSNIKIEQLTKTLEQVAEDISFVNKDSDNRTTSLKESLNALNSNVKSLNTSMKKQKSITGAHYKKITDLTKNFEKSKADLTKDLENLNSSISKNINDLQDQARNLAQTDRSLARQISGVNNNIGELSIAIDALNNKLNKISIKDIKDLQSAKNGIEQDIRSLTITTNRLTRQVEALLKRQK